MHSSNKKDGTLISAEKTDLIRLNPVFLRNSACHLSNKKDGTLIGAKKTDIVRLNPNRFPAV